MASVVCNWLSSAQATTYTVYRSTVPGVSGAVIGTVNAPAVTFTDTNVAASTTYWYGVTASNLVGESGLSTQAVVTTPPVLPPSTPQTITSFTVTPTSIIVGASVTVAWATANSTAVRLNGIPVAASGSTVDSPTAAKSYTLTVSGAVPDITQTKSVTVAAVAQTITSFTATPSTIATGSSTNIAWTTANATTVRFNGAVVPPNSFVLRSPTADTSYTLVASGSAPDVSSVLTVLVTPPNPGPPQTITTFTVAPAAITSGQTVTVTWATTNATLVRLNGSTVAASGSTPFSPTSNTSYTLLVSGTVADISQTKGVTVTQPAQTITSLTALPSSVTAGQSVTIAWTTTNATQVRLNGVVVAASGSTTDTPSANKTYTLVASGSAPDVSQSANVAVNPVPSAQTIVSFTLTPSSIFTGGSSTIAWSTTNATGVTLNGVAVGFNGSQTVTPSITTAYTLAVTGTLPTISQTQSVTVSAQPNVEFMPPATSLTTSDGVWTLVGIIPYLNGVQMTGSGSVMQRIADGMFIFGGDSYWYQWWSGQGEYPPGGWSRLSQQDPSINAFAPVPDYIGPSNTPSKWELEMTSFPAILAQAGNWIDGFGSTTGSNGIWAQNPQFLVDPSNGIQYLRFTNIESLINHQPPDGNGCGLINWYMAASQGLPIFYDYSAWDNEQLNVRWLVYIESDMEPALTDYGMKLPGIHSGQEVFNLPGERLSWRLGFHLPVNHTLPLVNYRYDSGITGGGFGDTYNYPINLHVNRWYCMEIRIALNTPGVANGTGQVWLDGLKIYDQNNILYRNDAATTLRFAHISVYHGGLRAPKGLMHFRIAKIGVSHSYIGVPTELIPGLPAWRVGQAVNEWREISNSAMANVPNTVIAKSLTGETATGGGNNYYSRLDAYCGATLDRRFSKLWTVAAGGHGDYWNNEICYQNLESDNPTWVIHYNGSSGNVIDNTLPPKARYTDGLPGSRHTYYQTQFLESQNRLLACGGSISPSGAGLADIDSFDITVGAGVNGWDNQYTYPGLFAGVGASPPGIEPSCCMDPRNGYIYSFNGLKVYRVKPTGTPNGTPGSGGTAEVLIGNSGINSGNEGATAVDTSRDRLIWTHGFGADSTTIARLLDLATNIITEVPYTGAAAADLATLQPGGNGIDYIPELDAYLLRAGGAGGKVYNIDADTLEATLLPTTGGGSIPQQAGAGWAGVYNKWQYVPNLGGIVYLPGAAYNTWFLRLF